jgi:multiple sugar transport system ATP-binding protein
MANVSLKNLSSIDPGRDGKDRAAVSNLNLEVQDREHVVLTGPAHCGISSIVRMIAGLDPVSKGDIFIGDRRANDLLPKDRDIALVSQDYAPYPRMSVYENIAFGLKRRKFPDPEIKKRVLAAAGIVGLEELLESKAQSLSSAQRQRVALARAIALQPKVFLFDEPFADLEAKTREQMRNLIAKLQQRLQATMIYATHEPIEAMALGGRIVVVNDGAIQQDGTAPSLYDEPANTFVAEFLSPPMNLVQGTLKQERDSLVFSEQDDGTIEVRWPIAEFPAAPDLVGKPVLLGIRPEEIGVAQPSTAGGSSGSFRAIVDLVEVIGAEVNIYLQTGAHTLVCRTGRRVDQQEAGHRLQFELNAPKVRLFDPVSRLRIK